jgi:tetratricopeptide (TPR) repeat protein
VLRGLAERPEARFASIDALLVALADDPAIRRRRRMALGGAVLAIAGVVAGGLWWRRQVRAERLAEDPCADPDPLAGAWDIAARERLRGAFHAAAGAEGDAIFARTAIAVDQVTAAWLNARERACAETRDDHVQPEGVLAVRLSCFDDQRDKLAELLALLEHGGRELVAEAPPAIHRVPGPSVCADARSLGAQEKPPPWLAPSVQLLRKRLAMVFALENTTQYQRADEWLESLVADARRVGYRPLLADAIAERCFGLGNLGREDLAMKTCTEAELVALAAHMDVDAANAAAERAQVGWTLGLDHATLNDLVERARAWHERAGDLESELSLEGLLSNGVPPEQAIVHDRRVEEIALEIYGEDSDITISARSNVAARLALLGRYDEALATQARIIAIAERLYGPTSETLGPVYQAHGDVLAMVGRHAEARAELQRALRVYSPTDWATGAAHCDLAGVELAEGDATAAIAECERGLTMIRHGDVHGVNLASNEEILAAAYLGGKRYADALALTRECIAEIRAERGEDVLEMASCLTDEGDALLELGKPAEAVGELERALGVLAGHAAAPGVRAEAQFLLARALVATRGDRARASELVAAARDELARYPFMKAKLAELDTWRASALGAR